MEIIHFPDDPRPRHWTRPVLALGNFDGLHRGHRKILDRVKRVAGEHGATALVMTFDPHPPRVVRPDKAPPLLMTKAQKLEAFEETGLQGAAIVRFTSALSRWDPEMFVKTVLVDWLRVSEVWVGANFLFGHDRTGNFSLLRALGARYGFRAEKIDPVRYKDFVVSSTRIRRLVGEGRVDEAGALLGHQYFIEGHIVRGDQRGRTIGFPTANLCTENELLPPHGVYATTITIEGIIRASVTNVGVRPTVDRSGQTTVETHIFDLDRDLYGAGVRVGFVQRLRDERLFESLDLLKVQIAADCGQARVLFGHLSL
jgi:riboflavin kinase/FMN adenylyltransferase